MSTPTPYGGGGAAIPLRPFTAWALLALAGLSVAFGFLGWILPPSRTDFFGRFSVDSFTAVAVLVAPLLAVLVAAKVGPPLRQATMVTVVALILYATALVLGGLAFLITLASRFDGLEGGIYALGGVVQRLGDILSDLVRLGLVLLALLWTYRIFGTLGGRFPHVNVRTD